jgi:hypothetical protein
MLTAFDGGIGMDFSIDANGPTTAATTDSDEWWWQGAGGEKETQT